MNESDYRRVEAWLDAALDIFRSKESKLTVSDIRIRALLGSLRQEVSQEITKARQSSDSRSPSGKECPLPKVGQVFDLPSGSFPSQCGSKTHPASDPQGASGRRFSTREPTRTAIS